MEQIRIIERLGYSLANPSCEAYTNLCFKPKQIQCFEYLLEGHDVIAILPTGYGKSLMFHLLPWVLPVKTRGENNIVLVVCPLSSIIKDQISVLNERGIRAESLPNIIDEKKRTVDSDLFPCDQSRPDIQICTKILQAEIDILFGHPESFLSSQGRELLQSPLYQRRVVACVVDEAHCVSTWGQNFRKDFGKLAVLRSYIDNVRFLAVTAKSTKTKAEEFSKTLCLKRLKIVSVSPNRKNIFLSLYQRKPSLYGFNGVKDILLPIAKSLMADKRSFPITVIYMKLVFCGMAYRFFDKVLGDEQYVGKIKSPRTRLFNQFHSPSTPGMKNDILEEIKNEDSRIRLLFATTALGMGVDAPDIKHVIHIGVPSSIESYVQEFGRAGRTNKESWATLYYNNSDIGKNTHVEDSIRNYCITDGCLRKYLANYFGFECLNQRRCCTKCNPELAFKINLKETKRRLDESCIGILKQKITACFEKYNEVEPSYSFLELNVPILPTADEIIEKINGNKTYYLTLIFY